MSLKPFKDFGPFKGTCPQNPLRSLSSNTGCQKPFEVFKVKGGEVVKPLFDLTSFIQGVKGGLVTFPNWAIPLTIILLKMWSTAPKYLWLSQTISPLVVSLLTPLQLFSSVFTGALPWFSTSGSWPDLPCWLLPGKDEDFRVGPAIIMKEQNKIKRKREVSEETKEVNLALTTNSASFALVVQFLLLLKGWWQYTCHTS